MPEGTMPYIVLWSLPGSGNTWLRYLIERVTGIFTGSVGNDKGLFDGGFRGQLLPAKSGRTVVVKTHSLIDVRDAEGILFLIRDPYGSAIAEVNRRFSKGHTSFATEERFMGPQWRTFAIDHVEQWALDIKHYVVLPQKKLIVYYEDLQNDLRNQLKRIVKFLGLSLDEQRLQCTLQHREGNFHRPKRMLSFDPFEKPVRLVINKSIRDVRQVMLKYHMPVMRSYERL
ncbi:WSC domain-containing protein 2 [Holothuria leucospilota]|uniref:WSC domain-containing protein 2 n=1 Tax=Holothuria leucospilota TaxID=206669 RepID=A0A9Q1CG43_HOLLE|nr:WSC domain-containing protein 2 [Holothuria leucospilota]